MKVISSILAAALLLTISCSINADDSAIEQPQAPVTEPSSPDISGTCARGQQCTSPGCGLWIDADRDGMCDRATGSI